MSDINITDRFVGSEMSHGLAVQAVFTSIDWAMTVPPNGLDTEDFTDAGLGGDQLALRVINDWRFLVGQAVTGEKWCPDTLANEKFSQSAHCIREANLNSSGGNAVQRFSFPNWTGSNLAKVVINGGYSDCSLTFSVGESNAKTVTVTVNPSAALLGSVPYSNFVLTTIKSSVQVLSVVGLTGWVINNPRILTRTATSTSFAITGIKFAGAGTISMRLNWMTLGRVAL